ncbi:rod shape-determining protein RodA [bacterium]|nr:rod shape-determining protein RodA [bacterium]
MRLESWRYFDYWLIAAVAVLVVFSIAMINSAIAGNPELLDNNTVQRQIIFALVGFVMIILITMYDYHFWSTIGRVMYVMIAVFLGLVVLGGGEEAFGSARWFTLFGQAVQPSELAKITIIVVMSDFFSRNQDKIGEIPWIIRSVVLTLGLVGLIYLQPDLSTSITIMVIWAALLFASGLKWKHIVLFVLVAVLMVAAIYPFLQDYQKQRVTNFLFTDEEARYGEQYNVNQALVTIGSGGWLGQGYGQGTQIQLRFLKVRVSDFIFSAIAHELGFVGTVFMMVLLFFIIYRILMNARNARDTYGALLCYGVATLIAFQTIINIGMNLKLLPVTGLPLPFISQGGSSLLSILLGVGLVESVAARQKIS